MARQKTFYMLKEIFEQPTSIRETIGSRFSLGEKCSFDDLSIASVCIKGTTLQVNLKEKILSILNNLN